jgi:hypothetical protein
MKRRILTLGALLLTGTFSLFAQQGRTCGTDAPCPEFETWMQQIIAARMADPTVHPDAIYTIPTIVHVIHNGESVGTGLNLSQNQINSQYDVLNEDFRKTNADFSTVCPSAFQSVAADCEINFCKALRNPSGVSLSQPGIDRINRNTAGFTAPPYSMSYCTSTIKPQTIWDPTRYLNVWVTDLSGGLLGYATFPAGSTLTCIPSPVETASNSGVVCLYTAFGRIGNLIPQYNRGRSATHEIGHWLGLRHIWGDASCGSDCVTDTPTQSTSNFGCPNFPQVTCSNGPNGDMWCNYMDYTDDPCMVMFTNGQKTRVQACMANGTYRAPLSNSTVCTPLSTDELYYENNFAVYPNPSKGLIHISSAFTENNLKVCVYNMIGEKVADIGKVADKEFTIRLEGMPAGLYIIEFNNGYHVSTQKVTIEK